jgi:Uma2 family endonuclease
MTAQPQEPLTQAEFPAWEQRQAAKHEFVDGHVYGFAGGTVSHSALASLLIQAIGPAALPCRTYGSDILIEMATSTRYPDVVVTCDERDRQNERTTIRHPKLVIEVLSAALLEDVDATIAARRRDIPYAPMRARTSSPATECPQASG